MALFTAVPELTITPYRFREEPYSGLFNCLNKIRQEEGFAALFRLWWFNALVVFQATGMNDKALDMIREVVPEFPWIKL